MKSDDLSFGIDRRTLVSGLALLPVLSGTLLSTSAQAQTTSAALASWNDGPAKQVILDFVRATTDQASQKFVPPEDRIATFDQDGTLWVEHPIYSQVVYCLDRVPAVVEKDLSRTLSLSKPCSQEIERPLPNSRYTIWRKSLSRH
jgi:hypothetical protein